MPEQAKPYAVKTHAGIIQAAAPLTETAPVARDQRAGRLRVYWMPLFRQLSRSRYEYRPAGHSATMVRVGVWGDGRGRSAPVGETGEVVRVISDAAIAALTALDTEIATRSADIIRLQAEVEGLKRDRTQRLADAFERGEPLFSDFVVAAAEASLARTAKAAAQRKLAAQESDQDGSDDVDSDDVDSDTDSE